MDVSPAVQQLILWGIGLLAGWFGPRPIEAISNKLGLEGPWALAFVYVFAFALGGIGVGLAVLACSLPFIGICLRIDGGIFELVIAITLAAQFSYHRLKDEGKMA